MVQAPHFPTTLLAEFEFCNFFEIRGILLCNSSSWACNINIFTVVIEQHVLDKIIDI